MQKLAAALVLTTAIACAPPGGTNNNNNNGTGNGDDPAGPSGETTPVVSPDDPSYVKITVGAVPFDLSKYYRGTFTVTATAVPGTNAVGSVKVSAGATVLCALTAAPYACAIDTTTLANGDNTLTVTGTDSSAVSVSITVVLKVDNAPPVLMPLATMGTPIFSGANNDVEDLFGEDALSGVDRAELVLERIVQGVRAAPVTVLTTTTYDATAKAFSGIIDSTSLADGIYHPRLIVFDKAGNSASTEADFDLYVENVAPTVTLTAGVTVTQGVLIRAAGTYTVTVANAGTDATGSATAAVAVAPSEIAGPAAAIACSAVGAGTEDTNGLITTVYTCTPPMGLGDEDQVTVVGTASYEGQSGTLQVMSAPLLLHVDEKAPDFSEANFVDQQNVALYPRFYVASNEPLGPGAALTFCIKPVAPTGPCVTPLTAVTGGTGRVDTPDYTLFYFVPQGLAPNTDYQAELTGARDLVGNVTADLRTSFTTMLDPIDRTNFGPVALGMNNATPSGLVKNAWVLSDVTPAIDEGISFGVPGIYNVAAAQRGTLQDCRVSSDDTPMATCGAIDGSGVVTILPPVGQRFPAYGMVEVQVEVSFPDGARVAPQLFVYFTQATLPGSFPGTDVAPRVVNVTAPFGATEQVGTVGALPSFLVSFSEAVDPLTVNAMNVRLFNGGNPVEIAVQPIFRGTSLKIDSLEALPAGATLTLTTEHIAGLSARNTLLMQSTLSTFTTTVETDTTAPFLTQQMPGPAPLGATAVLPERYPQIRLDYNEAVRTHLNPDQLFGYETILADGQTLLTWPVYGWTSEGQDTTRGVSWHPTFHPAQGAQQLFAGSQFQAAPVVRDAANNLAPAFTRTYTVESNEALLGPWVQGIDATFVLGGEGDDSNVRLYYQINDCDRVLSARFYTQSASVNATAQSCGFSIGQMEVDQLLLGPGRNEIFAELVWAVSGPTGPTASLVKSIDVRFPSAPPVSYEASYGYGGAPNYLPAMNGAPVQMLNAADASLVLFHESTLITGGNSLYLKLGPNSGVSGVVSGSFPSEQIPGLLDVEKFAFQRVSALIVPPDLEQMPVESRARNLKGINGYPGYLGSSPESVKYDFNLDIGVEPYQDAMSSDYYSSSFALDPSFSPAQNPLPMKLSGLSVVTGPTGCMFEDALPAVQGCAYFTSSDRGIISQVGVPSSTGPFTVEAWVRLDQAAGDGVDPVVTFADVEGESSQVMGGTEWTELPNASFAVSVVRAMGADSVAVSVDSDPGMPGILEALSVFTVTSNLRDGGYHYFALRVTPSAAQTTYNLCVDGKNCTEGTTSAVLPPTKFILVGGGYDNDNVGITLPHLSAGPPPGYLPARNSYLDAMRLSRGYLPDFDIRQHARNNGLSLP